MTNVVTGTGRFCVWVAAATVEGVDPGAVEELSGVVTGFDTWSTDELEGSIDVELRGGASVVDDPVTPGVGGTVTGTWVGGGFGTTSNPPFDERVAGGEEVVEEKFAEVEACRALRYIALRGW
jgi:hypothetical protein